MPARVENSTTAPHKGRALDWPVTSQSQIRKLLIFKVFYLPKL